ncbi:MAG: hypothetical protein M1838_003323 [Thelocarpon superellum]|nr:MAG: hypothetical protein M1838_003323 [Thelocarpon superellum]
MSTDSPLATGAPVVLLSPALATSRFFYNGMAESIAGAGYIVAVVDHPYDASLVEFPDGSTVTGVNVDQPGNTSQIILDTEVRAQDMIFTLNQLGNGTFQLGRPSSSGAGAASSSHSSAQGAEAGLGLDTSRALAAGHSLGGAAAAAAMMLDSRFVGCFNLDGEFLGPVTQTGLNGPVMIFASNGTDLNTKQLWTAEWPILRGWKLLVRLLPSQHMSLSDTPLLVTTLNGNNVSESAVAESGPLSGIRVRAIVQAYMTSFFHFALTNQTASILQGPDPTNYPEVTYPGSPANLPQDDPPDRDGDDGPDDGDGSGSGNSTSTANNGKSTSGTGSGNIQPGGSISGSNAGGSDDGDD